jgi:hypothetical protein
MLARMVELYLELILFGHFSHRLPDRLAIGLTIDFALRLLGLKPLRILPSSVALSAAHPAQ